MAGVPTDPDAPTEALVSSAVGDRCVSCGAPLSSDQRYCVVCGERRGAPRFTLPAPAASVVTETTRSAPNPRRRPRFGSGTTLVAGVATLLLAVLVGVVIGHSAAGGGTKTVAAGPTKIIKISSGGSAAPATGTPAASSPSSSGSGSGSGSHHSSSKSSHAKTKKSSSNSTAVHTTTISKQVATQAQNAASKVTGGSNGAAATSTVGSSCKAGSAGCNSKTHKFDGSFFGQ